MHAVLLVSSPPTCSRKTQTFHFAVYVQGNCTAQPTGTLDPPRKSNTQCLILVRENFLEVPTEGSQVWISNLHVKLAGLERHHTTLIGVHGGDVYLTNMSFICDKNIARAIDVKENRKLYVSSANLLLLPVLCAVGSTTGCCLACW